MNNRPIKGETKTSPVENDNSSSEPVTLEELKVARVASAISIQKYGEKFLPLFKCIDAEIKSREIDKSDLEAALKYASITD